MSLAERLAALASAAAAVLFRYSWSEAIGLGVALEDATGRVIGLEIALSPTDTLGALLTAVRACLASAQHDPMPVSRWIPNDEAHNPYFSVLVGAPTDVGRYPELRHDLTLWLEPSPLALRTEHHSRLFERTSVERFLVHVAHYVDALLRTPAGAVGDVDFLSLAEAAILMQAESGDAAPLPEPAAVQAMFAIAARATPTATALVSSEGSMSYLELDRSSDRLAALLAARIAAPGVRVGLAVRPGMHQIVALLGVLKSGATPVPVDSSFPRRRLTDIIEQADLALIIAESALAERYDGTHPIARLDDLLMVGAQLDAVSVGPGRPPADLVYLLFTSGSTGVPKGIAMRQSTLANLVSWQHRCTPATRRTLNRSSLGFDVSFQEIFSTLCFGGTLVVADERERQDVSTLRSFIAAHRVDRIFLPPVALQQLAEISGSDAQDLAALRHVIVAGDALHVTPAIVRLFRACPASLINQYGPTETHVATSYALDGSSMRWPLRPPIGRPISNAKVYVLDPLDHRCALGTVGEICIGGMLPARGYVNQPEQTAERFVADPYAGAHGAVMYRTGDVGRVRADGLFEFLGRRDAQVKLRGYRIELGDLEAHAAMMPGVRMVAADLRERARHDEFLALFVTPEAPGALDAQMLRRFLAERLPAHMVPSVNAIVFVDDLPVNANGKIDRRRLPELPHVAAASLGAGGVTTAERLADIWKRCLRIDHIAPDDDFLALGGHSLTAIHIVSATNDALDVKVPLDALLRGGTLRGFTAVVENLLNSHAAPLRKREHGATPRVREPLELVKLDERLEVLAPYAAEAHHFYEEIFVREAYFRHGITVGADGVVIDVGANIGMFTLYVLRRFPDVKIYALEPAPALFDALVSNTAPHRARVTLINSGAGDHDGSMAFTYYPALTGMSSFYPDPRADRNLLEQLILAPGPARSALAAILRGAGDYWEGRLAARIYRRPVRRLSSLLPEIGPAPVELLKIDVQRGELQVLEGLAPADWPRIARVVVEYQAPDGPDDALLAKLLAEGFEVTVEQDAIHRGTNVKYAYAVRAR